MIVTAIFDGRVKAIAEKQMLFQIRLPEEVVF